MCVTSNLGRDREEWALYCAACVPEDCMEPVGLSLSRSLFFVSIILALFKSLLLLLVIINQCLTVMLVDVCAQMVS